MANPTSSNAEDLSDFGTILSDEGSFVFGEIIDDQPIVESIFTVAAWQTYTDAMDRNSHREVFPCCVEGRTQETGIRRFDTRAVRARFDALIF